MNFYPIVKNNDASIVSMKICQYMKELNYLGVGVLTDPCIKITRIGDKAIGVMEELGLDDSLLERIINQSAKNPKTSLPLFTGVGISHNPIDGEYKVRLTLYCNEGTHLFKVLSIDDKEVNVVVSYSRKDINKGFLEKNKKFSARINIKHLKKMYGAILLIKG